MTDDLLGGEDIAVDPNKNYLEELVGDGKKFKSPEELARGKYEADLTIELFKRRQDELRNDYLKLREEHMAGAQLKDLIDQIRSEKQQLASSESTPAKEDKPVIDFNEIDARVEAKIEAAKLKEKQDANFNAVVAKLEEQFGSNYKQNLKQQADALGLSPEDVNTLARKSPTAFMKTFGIGEQRGDLFQSPVRSSQRSDSFAPTTPKRSWSYYQNLKQKDPVAYADAKTHNQMVDDYRNLGKDFEDGDFAKFN